MTGERVGDGFMIVDWLWGVLRNLRRVCCAFKKMSRPRLSRGNIE